MNTAVPVAGAEGTTVAGGNGAGSAPNQFSYPSSIFVDASGNIFITDRDNYRIQKWALGATVGSTVAGGNGAGSAPNQLNRPTSVFVDASGNIFIADRDNYRIQKWAQGATSGTTVGGGNGNGSADNQLAIPTGICLNAYGKVFIADGGNHRIQKSAPVASNTYTPTTAGSYTAVVTVNGCSTTTNAVVINPLPTAPLVTTPVNHCRNAVAGALTANGTNLKWYNAAIGGTSAATVIPKTDSIGTTAYWVTQTNALGCESDRTKIEVAVEVFKNTLLRQRTLCKDQYFAFDLKNPQYPNLTHRWTSSTGYTSSKEIDTLRNAGTYFVQTTTALGCKSNDSVTITLNTAFIESNFAVATQLVTVDVIKVVNISNSVNDSMRWIVPAGLNVISNTPALLEIVARDTGRYSLGLMTFKGVCSDVTYQNIHISPKTFDQNANDTLYFVKSFTAYPNPSQQGENLRVKIELTKERSVKLRLIDANMNTIIDNKVLQGSAIYDVDYGTTLRKGAYILFLESPYGRNVLKIIVL